MKHPWINEKKDFLEFNKNEVTIYPNPCDTMKAGLRGKFIALCLHKENEKSSHQWLNRTPEISRKKRSRLTKKEYKTGNNQIKGWNQQNRNKGNTTKNQCNK